VVTVSRAKILKNGDEKKKEKLTTQIRPVPDLPTAYYIGDEKDVQNEIFSQVQRMHRRKRSEGYMMHPNKLG